MNHPSNLARQARAAVSDLGESCRLSLPFVARLDGEFHIGMLAYPAVPRPRQASVVFPPSHLIYLNAATLKLVRRVEIRPAEVVASQSPGKAIGEYGIPSGISYDDFLKLEATLHAHTPGLFAKLNAEAAKPAGAGQAGRENLAGFNQVSEPPLAPYYEKFGKEFFAYLKRE